jgi:hypothetical protein
MPLMMNEAEYHWLNTIPGLVGYGVRHALHHPPPEEPAPVDCYYSVRSNLARKRCGTVRSKAEFAAGTE